MTKAYLSPEDFMETETISGVRGVLASTDETWVKSQCADRRQNVKASLQWYEITLPKLFTFINYGLLLAKQHSYILERLYNEKTISLISSKDIWKNNEPLYGDESIYKKLQTPEELFSYLNAKTENDNVFTTSFLYYLGINGVCFENQLLVFEPRTSITISKIKREDS